MPGPHEADKAQNHLVRKSQLAPYVPTGGRLLIKIGTVVDNRNPGSPANPRHPLGQDLRHRQDPVGAAPQCVFAAPGDTLERQIAEPGALLGERRIDLQKHGQTQLALQPETGEQVEIVALVKNVGPECFGFPLQPPIGGDIVGQFH